MRDGSEMSVQESEKAGISSGGLICIVCSGNVVLVFCDGVFTE